MGGIMRSVCKALLLVALALLPVTAQAQCLPVDHANDDYMALNRFWGTNIPICQLRPGSNNAYADRDNGVVWADQSWLDQMAGMFGNWAATGILAHEWGHMIQGNSQGTAAELQADCLAGVFMRGAGLPPSTMQQFANANFFNGDPRWSYVGHGTGPQRMSAAMRGYHGYRGQTGLALQSVCPFSAF